MTRTQRAWHAWTWAALGPLILIGLLIVLADRPTASGQPPLAPSFGAAHTQDQPQVTAPGESP